MKLSSRSKHGLRAIVELAMNHGQEPLQILSIAQKAGIATGTALTHFSDKKSLLAATLYDDLEAAFTQAFYTFSPEKPFIEILIHICSAVFYQFDKTPELSKILLRDTLFAEDEWGKRLDMVWKRSDQVGEIFLENMKASGQLREDSDCNVLARGAILIYASTLVMGLKVQSQFPSRS